MEAVVPTPQLVGRYDLGLVPPATKTQEALPSFQFFSIEGLKNRTATERGPPGTFSNKFLQHFFHRLQGMNPCLHSGTLNYHAVIKTEYSS